MNQSIARKLTLQAEWEDKGLSKGLSRGKAGLSEVKKQAQAVAKAGLAIAAGLIAATAALFKFIKAGAEVKSIRDSFDGFVASAGMAPDTLDRIREAVRGTIADADLLQGSIAALSSGLAPDELIRFWEMAKQIADVASRDTLEVFGALSRAVNKLEAESLEQIGITVRMGDINKAYADSIGKNVDALSTQERQTAFMNAVNEKYIKNFWSVGDVTTRTREKFQQMSARVQNVKDQFVLMVAKSPSVQTFLDMIIGRIEEFSKALVENEPKIQSFVDSFTGLLDRIDGYVGRLDEFKEKAADFWEKWEAPIKGAGAAGLTAKLGGGLASILVGFGVISGPVGLLVVTILATVVGLLVSLNVHLDNMAEKADEATSRTLEDFNRVYDVFAEKQYQGTLSLSEFSEAWDHLGYKIDETAEKAEKAKVAPEGARIPGGLPEPKPADIRPILPERMDTARSKEDTKAQFRQFEVLPEAFQAVSDSKIEIAQQTADELLGIEQYRVDNYLHFLSVEESETRKNLSDRIRAYDSAFNTMSRYSDKFFKKGAHMGRALNAMMIAGFSEMVASYIESKTRQARYDAMEYGYKALAALAHGRLDQAAAFGAAAAQAGVVAGAGAILAGYARARGQEQADKLTEETDRFDEGDAGGDVEGEGQRRRAGGLVKARPIYINVTSNVNIETGVAIFGDAESGVGELYETHIRGRIDDDLETGMLATG